MNAPDTVQPDPGRTAGTSILPQTTGRPVRLEAELYRKELQTGQIAQIELCTRDAQGRFVPDATPLVSCSVKGPAHLLGMDGGDLRDLSLYSLPERRMAAGRLLAAVRCDGPGHVCVRFETEEGLCTELHMEIRDGQIPSGVMSH